MDWIHNFRLFLFDMDGLLVNTEELHYLAYQKMVAAHGFDLGWNFRQYCLAAHYGSDRLRAEINRQVPGLQVGWDTLYAEKQKFILELLEEGDIHLMPGAQQLLEALNKANVITCVVTHSPDRLVRVIREKNPLLDHISQWITRHDYTHPKPHPECYQKAIALLSKKNGGRIIGFEDTPKGVQSLLQTEALPVMISKVPYPELASLVNQGVKLFSSLEDLSDM